MRKMSVVALATFTVMLMVLALAVPMASMQDATPTPQPTLTSVPPVDREEGEIEVTFWYGLGGLLGNVVQETVNMYNESQSEYYINAVFQSSYDDTINRINAGLASGELPDVVQVFEAGTQRMIDTGSIIPVQQFFERDGLEAVIEDMEPAARANYTVGGTLYSAPFNSSTAMLYIDRAAFAEAGLDADQPLVTYDQVADYARALTVSDDAGNVTRYGLSLCAEGWYFEQIHAVHDTLMGTPDNGRTTRMEQYTYNDPIAVQWLDWQKMLIDEGVAQYYGTAGAGGCTAANAALTTGEAAMSFSSIASLRTIIAGAERAGAGVDVGVLYMPRTEGATGKTIVGGASLWILNVGSTDVQEGAWDFVRWAMQPEVQAFWSINTGYYPVVRAAYDLPEMQEGLAQFPQFQVAVDQIRLADITDANTAHISGTFVSMRQDVIQAMDAYFTGTIATAQEALDIAVSTSNDLLEEYNLNFE
jgi:sn-glycerol 3-phosphate transport system substrate-binding protein